ncbi:MAG TPA: hypothetical protein VF266_21535 [Thermoanaerobaculia bacterium]
MKRNKMLKRLSALAVLLAVAMVPGPLSGDDQVGYTDCMDRAINHKYALIADGWSYADAHEHYLWHTRQCYERFYGGGMLLE